MSGKVLTPEMLANAVARNFGGNPDLIDSFLQTFLTKCFPKQEIKKNLKPSTRSLIEQNLKDRKSRHLMLLTRNDSALPLIFGSDILNPLNTIVLVGSNYKDDKTEFYLVNQINQIKMAMADGKTVVLLNHDNIYEALYDVLNQRYVQKTDSESDKVRKMLRLAIGSKSQLCNVHEDFKMIVIVDQNHATANLDTPLLNRFEKQMLCPQQLLEGEEMKAVVENVNTWATEIIEETKIKSFQDLFCGFYEGTIPSAVLTHTQFDNQMVIERGVEQIASEVKRNLFHVALPIAVMHSSHLQKIQEDYEIDYFETHSTLRTIVDNYILPDENDLVGSLSIILTHSPVSHFDAEGEYKEFSFLSLSGLTKESELEDRVKKFFGDRTDQGSKILFVQCDPIHCEAKVINHARQICFQQFSSFRNKLQKEMEFGMSNEEKDRYKRNLRHIVFLVHLPPGIRQRTRHFSLDLYYPWKNFFIDDIRGDVDQKVLPYKPLLQNSVFDLINSGMLSLETLIESNFQRAMVSYGMEFLVDLEHMRNLLRLPKFRTLVKNFTMTVLETFKDPEPNGMFKHVRMVCDGDAICGNLRQSLHFAIELIFAQALTNVFCILDRNRNISLLDSSEEATRLWFGLSSLHTILDTTNISRTVRLGGKSVTLEVNPAPNTGRHGTLAVKFPFSWGIIRVLNDPETREQIELVIKNNDQQDLQGVLNSISGSVFGDEVVDAWNSFGRADHMDYLHDYVASSTPPFPGLNFETQFKVYEAIVRATRNDSMCSPPGIHAACWNSENRLFNICSLLSKVNETVRATLVEILVNASRSNDLTSISSTEERLNFLDSAFVFALTKSYWEILVFLEKQSSPIGRWLEYTGELSSIDVDIQSILSDIKNSNSLYRGMSRKNLVATWLSISFARLSLQELFIPDMKVLQEEKAIAKRNNPFAGMFGKVNEKQNPKFVEILKNISDRYDHSLFSYFSEVMNMANKLISEKIKDFAIENFVIRYIQQFIFGEQEGFIKFSTEINYPEEKLANLLLDAVSGNIAELSGLSCRRLILKCLLNAEDKIGKLPFANIQGAQLYLHYQEELLGGDNIPELEPKHVEIILENVERITGENINDYLDAVSIAKFHIKNYCENFVTAFSELSPADRKNHRLLPQPNGNLFLVLDTDSHISSYALSVMRLRAGLEIFGEIIFHANSVANWIKMDRQHCKSLVSELPNPIGSYYFISAMMQKLNGIVSTIVTRNIDGGNELDKVYLEDSPLHNSLLMNSIFNHLVVTKDVVPKGVKSLESKIMNRSIPAYFRRWVFQGGEMDVGNLTSHCQQIASHLFIWSTLEENAEVWPSLMVKKLSECGTRYLPTFDDDEKETVARAMGKVGWYTCPKGHPYSVGECTHPMQEAICNVPDCGAKIGGKNHVAVDGVKRLDKLGNNETIPGYVRNHMNNDQSQRVAKTTHLTLRVMLNTLVLALSSVDPERIIGLVYPDRKDAKIDDLRKEISGYIQKDWRDLKKQFRINDNDLLIVFHIIIADSIENCKRTSMTSPEERATFETNFENSCKIYYSRTLQDEIAKARASSSSTTNTAVFKMALGEKVWNWTSFNLENPSENDRLWRYRDGSSFDHFKQTFEGMKELQKQYPLIAAFLKEEERLPIIKYMTDVLAWHTVLFEALGSSRITREDAAIIKNSDVINMLPENKRRDAEEIMLAFCEGFNKAFPLIDNLYECQANPYLTKDGKVDLSGTKSSETPMSPDSPVCFSLPSMIQGETDAPGLCTIQLLNLMQNSFTQVLSSLDKVRRSGSRYGVEFRRKNAELEDVPPISYLTQSKMVRQKLINYEREKNLLPLLYIHTNQGLAFGEGVSLTYDFQRIEEALANEILAGKSPINLNIRHFQYTGDLKKTGRLSSLRVKIAQESLGSSLQESIWNEIDTQERLSKLMGQLEICINFLVGVGGSSVKDINGRTSLQDYALNVLHIPKETWDSVSTPSISQHVMLCHLQSLFMSLEEKIFGSPLDNIHSKYRAKLPLAMDAKLRRSLSKFDLKILLPVMRDFMIEQLTSGNWDEKAKLKEYLTYGTEIDLGELEWYNTHFPEDLTLEHSLSAFQLFSDYQSK